MNFNDPQVVVWSKWTGLTGYAAGHLQYSCFDHNGASGGSHSPFKPRSESHLFGIRMGWWAADACDYVVYNPVTLNFAAAQAIYLADENPS
jgi:hypothetical protein